MDDGRDVRTIWREERAGAGLCFALVLPFALFVLIDGRVTALEQLKLMAAFAGTAIAIGVGALFCFAMLELAQTGRRTRWLASPSVALRQALARRWRDDRLFSLAWPVALFLVLLPAFNAFKQRILPAAGFRLDPELAAIDRTLFGTDPGPALHGLIGSPTVTVFFDALYHAWFMPTTLGICVVGLCAGTRSRAQYMLTYSGVWIILGAIAAWWLPAAGPAFYEALVGPAGAEPFRAVYDHLAATGGQDRFLSSLGNQAYLLGSLDAPVLAIGGGISAIPSVHNAIAALFAVAAFRAHRLLGLVASAYAVLIWIASVYLNWHYAIDGLVGIAGAIALWLLAGVMVDRTFAAARGKAESRLAAAAA